MPLYKFVLGLRQGGKTATEYYYQNASTLPDAGKLAGVICNLRNAMLFSTTQWVGVRIGIDGGNRAAQLYKPGKYELQSDGLDMTIPSQGLLMYTKNKNSADQPRACIQIVLRYGDVRSTKRYLAFCPDEVISGDPDSVQLKNNPAFGQAYSNFANYLTATMWQIKARDYSGVNAPQPIRAWVASDAAPNPMGAVIDLNTAPTIKVGDKVSIKGVRRKGTDRVSYNMTYRASAIVDSSPSNTRTVYLGQSQGGDPSTIKVLGTLQLVVQTAYPIQRWSWFAAGTHKRGVSFGASRGRLLRRVLIDP